ncbi:hypothetical protein CGLAMM_05225 [Acetobacteraceae bacterium EV16G]|uniref:Uncharacterized protein n=1 Tax=Sorlinia euscelidii TaxID=3081148 RepID=A0ABU7U015_9PROT
MLSMLTLRMLTTAKKAEPSREIIRDLIEVACPSFLGRAGMPLQAALFLPSRVERDLIDIIPGFETSWRDTMPRRA